MDETNDSRGREGLWNADFVLLCASALAFFTSFYLLISTLPGYVVKVGGGDVSLGLVMGAFAFSSLAFRPVVGRAVDRRGRKRMVLVGALIFVASSSLYWFARSVPLLIAVRLLHGAGMAFFTTAATTIVADAAPAARRGEAMGIFGITGNLGLAVGPPVGVALLAAAHFGGLFLVSAAVAAAALALAVPVTDRGFVPHRHQTEANGIHSFLSREVLMPSLAVFAVMLTYGPLMTFLPSYAGVTRAGIFYTAYALAIAAFRALTGRASDRFGRRAVIAPGMVVLALAMVLLGRTTSLTGLVMVAVLYGAGMAAAQPALYALAVDMAGERRRGIAMGTFTAAFELGIGGGAIAAGLLVRSFGYSTMFISAGLAPALGLLAFLARRGGVES